MPCSLRQQHLHEKRERTAKHTDRKCTKVFHNSSIAESDKSRKVLVALGCCARLVSSLLLLSKNIFLSAWAPLAVFIPTGHPLLSRMADRRSDLPANSSAASSPSPSSLCFSSRAPFLPSAFPVPPGPRVSFPLRPLSRFPLRAKPPAADRLYESSAHCIRGRTGDWVSGSGSPNQRFVH